jgi:tRNA-dihydrouridine synthase 1
MEEVITKMMERSTVEPAAMESDEPQQLSGLEFWKQNLNGARYIVAPMVDQSELAWRMLSRRYGAQLCYTPMLHASVFVRDANYRREAMVTCPEDRPLIIQFCANDPDTLLKACKYVEDHCDAVDLNLGCPQSIAKRGHYGAFLQDEWQLLYEMVNRCARELKIPITCKIRVFDDVQRSIEYAKMLERAGAKLLTVHGRTREQKGPNTGTASWAHIKAIRKSISIPVFANGNIQYFADIEQCVRETGVEGVMSAEGNLHNPALFADLQPPAWQMAEEYMELVDRFPCPMSFIRGHIFKLMHHLLLIHTEFRDLLGSCRTAGNFKKIISDVKEKCRPDVEAYERDPKCFIPSALSLPYWLCQPYVRPPATPLADEDNHQPRENIKRPLELINGTNDPTLSINKLKKLRRYTSKTFVSKPDKFEKCGTCGNPKGLKCVFDECKACCRASVHRNSISCPGHKLFKRKSADTLKVTDTTVAAIPAQMVNN